MSAWLLARLKCSERGGDVPPVASSPPRLRGRRRPGRSALERLDEVAGRAVDWIALRHVLNRTAGEHDGAVLLATALSDARLAQEGLGHADRPGRVVRHDEAQRLEGEV